MYELAQTTCRRNNINSINKRQNLSDIVESLCGYVVVFSLLLAIVANWAVKSSTRALLTSS